MQSVSRSKVLKVEEREEVVRRRRIEYSIVARTERAEVTVAVETHTPRLKLEGSSLIVSSCTYENHASFPRYITGRARARASVASVRGETFRSVAREPSEVEGICRCTEKPSGSRQLARASRDFSVK